MASLAIDRPLHHRVSWGALFAGFFFGFGVWMVLLALGAGIGIAAFDPRDLQNWQGLGIGFGIWGVVAGIVAMFLAGWLTARLSSAASRTTGLLHGAALWGFMLVAGLWIATMAIGKTASTAAQAAGGAAEAAAGAAGGAASDPQGRAQVRRQANRAEQQVQGMAQSLSENKDEAAAAAKTAGAAGAWAFFLYGLLTLAAAMLGGRTGVPRVLVERRAAGSGVPGEPLPHRA